MFMGEFHHNIDAKGRLIVPAKFRAELEQGFILTRGMDGCIFGYPLQQWQKLEQQLQQLPLTKKKVRFFVRFFYASAGQYQLDLQGRVNIDPVLIEYAELKKDCVIAGVSERFEIWNAYKWAQISEQTAQSFDLLSEEMHDLVDFDL
ncbi:division/cell wall cluster transcriptional repressor MraZ [Bombilactobacillus thymidiniphilus]|uniref:Transcriptional regulator MraZ n=1 Tax=Bombilactobacillus thymidiniphilus TaxID=2923363 RepID=A0ABY4PEY6_9LACO|nr:division/cell wall cluster transcriptional repressor MraZ [Bombilactobacillus thymidiniphilus]UQS84320.1 division/cell wall cluster transcriptional repressor MraZ [Bombilactobacillus thymidiniphilus]